MQSENNHTDEISEYYVNICYMKTCQNEFASDASYNKYIITKSYFVEKAKHRCFALTDPLSCSALNEICFSQSIMLCSMFDIMKIHLLYSKSQLNDGISCIKVTYTLCSVGKLSYYCLSYGHSDSFQLRNLML